MKLLNAISADIHMFDRYREAFLLAMAKQQAIPQERWYTEDIEEHISFSETNILIGEEANRIFIWCKDPQADTYFVVVDLSKCDIVDNYLISQRINITMDS